MDEYCRELMSYVDHMGSREWLFVAVVGVVIGMMCLRGLGSRSSY